MTRCEAYLGAYVPKVIRWKLDLLVQTVITAARRGENSLIGRNHFRKFVEGYTNLLIRLATE